MSETKSVYAAYSGNTYLFGGNAPYVEEMYENYLANPGSVPDTWRSYFDALQHVPASDGSDAKDVAVLADLREAGARVAVGFDPSQLGRADSVVMSSAIRDDNFNLGTRFALPVTSTLRSDCDPGRKTARITTARSKH